MSKFFFKSLQHNLAAIKKVGKIVTGRKQLQEKAIECNKLNERLKRMQQVFEYATDGLFFTDVLDDGRFNIIEINPAFKTMSGVTEDQINRPFDESQDNGDGSLKFIVSRYREAVATKNTVEYKITFNNHTTHTRLIPVPDENDKIAHVIGMSRDITQQKEYEKELFNREKEFRSLAENSPDIITRFDPDLNRIYANSAYQQLTGFSPETTRSLNAPQKPMQEVITQRLKTLLQEVKDTCVLNETVLEWNNAKDGYKCFHLRAVPEFDKKGNLESILTIARDVSDRKKAKDLLHEAKNRLLSIVTTIPDLVWLKDTNGVHLFCNAAFAEFFGAPEEEVIGKTDYDIVDSEQADFYREKDLAVLTTGKMSVHQATTSNRLGQSGIFETRKVPVYNAMGEITGVLGIARDITEQKKAEEENRRMRIELAAALQAIPDLMFEMDKNGMYIDIWAKEASQLTQQKDNILGRTIYDILPYEAASVVHNSIKEAAQNEYSYGKVYYLDLAVGRRWFELSVSRKNHSKSGEEHFIAIARDITDRKLLEQELKDSQDFIDKVINSIPYPVYVKDREHQFILSNEAHNLFLRYTNEEVLGKTDFDFYPAYEAEKFKKQEDTCFNTGKEIFQEDSIVNEKGEKKFSISRKVSFSDSHGKEFLVGIISDITKLKESEEALRKSEQMVRRKLNSILSPNISLDALELSDIIDINKVQPLLEKFNKITNIAIGIIDNRGNMLVETGWQDICTKFHRNNPQTCRLCGESKTELCSYISAGNFKEFNCKNNMRDIATPIVIGGKHMGNLLLAQFMYDDECPNLEIFREHAKRYRFNEPEYLEALDKIPRLNRKSVDALVSFHAALADLIGSLSYSNIMLAHLLEKQKRMKDKIHKQNEFQQILLEGLRDTGLILLVVENGKVIYNNDYHHGYQLGYAKEDMDETPDFIKWVHPKDRKQTLNQYKKRLRGENVPNSYELGGITKNGERREYELFVTPIPGTDPVQLIALKRDITQRKKVEHELIEAKEKAEESNRLKSAFLATINHELRTPLHQIMGFSQLIALNPNKSELYANIIHDGGKRLLEIVEDVLALAVSEQSAIKIRKNSFVLEEVFSTSKRLLYELLNNSGKNDSIELVFKADADLLPTKICSDLTKLNQLLVNLFKNAIKFTEKGYIEYGVLSNDPNWVTFYIKDTGVGISEDKLPIIYDFFRQGDDSNSRRYDGVGIGLAIAMKIAKLLNGLLYVESVVDKGSTFYLKIPVDLNMWQNKPETENQLYNSAFK